MVELAREMIKNPRNPLTCVLKILYECFRAMVEMISRFTVCVAAITGGDFKSAVKISYGLLGRYFHEGIYIYRYRYID